MSEQYFVQPGSWDRIRASWLGRPIEDYVGWLATQGYSASTIRQRVFVLMHLADHAGRGGASRVEDLPDLVEAFVAHMARSYRRRNRKAPPPWFTGKIRISVEQMLQILLPGMPCARRRLPFPFRDSSTIFCRNVVCRRQRYRTMRRICDVWRDISIASN